MVYTLHIIFCNIRISLLVRLQFFASLACFTSHYERYKYIFFKFYFCLQNGISADLSHSRTYSAIFPYITDHTSISHTIRKVIFWENGQHDRVAYRKFIIFIFSFQVLWYIEKLCWLQATREIWR